MLGRSQAQDPPPTPGPGPALFGAGGEGPGLFGNLALLGAFRFLGVPYCHYIV